MDNYTDNNPVIFEVTIGSPVLQEVTEEIIYSEVVVTIGSLVITIDDVPMLITTPPYIENNRTMLPVRYVVYALGLSPENLHWDETTRSVIIFNKEDEIRFAINNEFLFVNGEPRVMDSAAVLDNGTAYLPVRYLAEAMDVFFEWDGEAAAVRFFVEKTL
jgi:hypothetical protein